MAEHDTDARRSTAIVPAGLSKRSANPVYSPAEAGRLRLRLTPGRGLARTLL
jgi:hypothetical protein